MRNLILGIITLVSICFTTNLSAFTCDSGFWFEKPTSNKQFETGSDVYVKVKARRYQDIEYMKLYLNGQYIRKESSSPYEWCKSGSSGDNFLRNMQAGHYTIKVKVKDRCGRYFEKECRFEIKNGYGGANGHCEWDSWFEYPNCGGKYDKGSNVYVKVKAKKYQDIEYMKLYVNGQFVRKESSTPYEWCKSNSSGDYQLKNMNTGHYRVKVLIKDKCGETHERECAFEIKHGGGTTNNCIDPNQINPNAICSYIYNPVCGCNNVTYSNSCVAENAGVQAWTSGPCSGGGTTTTCDRDSWFEYPNCGGKYDKGSNVYVKVKARKHQDIEYMKLYVNGQFVRKESTTPYEWCKSNSSGDYQLRNMKTGHYRVKVVIKDKCGKTHEQECEFEIKGEYGNGGGNNCQWDSWFEYPKNTHVQIGSDVYVKVKAQRYQDIEYMKLYVDGHFVRKETQTPYEWCKSNSSGDYQLRNLKPGEHKITVKIKDKCGFEHEVKYTVNGAYL